jgi:hypothetical protein
MLLKQNLVTIPEYQKGWPKYDAIPQEMKELLEKAFQESKELIEFPYVIRIEEYVEKVNRDKDKLKFKLQNIVSAYWCEVFDDFNPSFEDRCESPVSYGHWQTWREVGYLIERYQKELHKYIVEEHNSLIQDGE